MKPADENRLIEQLSAYLDGELNDAQRAEVEAFLSQNESARRLLAELRQTSALLGSLPRGKAPPDLADEISQQIERRALLGSDDELFTERRSGTRGAWRWLATAAALMLTVSAGWMTFSYMKQESQPKLPSVGPVADARSRSKITESLNESKAGKLDLGDRMEESNKAADYDYKGQDKLADKEDASRLGVTRGMPAAPAATPPPAPAPAVAQQPMERVRNEVVAVGGVARKDVATSQPVMLAMKAKTVDRDAIEARRSTAVKTEAGEAAGRTIAADGGRTLGQVFDKDAADTKPEIDTEEAAKALESLGYLAGAATVKPSGKPARPASATSQEFYERQGGRNSNFGVMEAGVAEPRKAMGRESAVLAKKAAAVQPASRGAVQFDDCVVSQSSSSRPTSRPTSRPATKPATCPTTQPATGSTTKPATCPATQPATRPVR